MEEKGDYTPQERALSISEIKRRVPIEKVLNHYGFKGGINLRDIDLEWHPVRCPFHPDTQASASLSLKLNRFRCHGCDVGGDIFDVVAAAEHTDTKGAMEWIRRNLL